MIKDLILKNRSYRRFFQDYRIDYEMLKELVDLARLSASARNLQPLKYILSCEPAKNNKIFSCLGWAKYLSDGAPKEGEKPSAYIIILGDTTLSSFFDYDAGIAAQSIMLGVVEGGLGGCIMATIQRDKLRSEFSIDEKYKILLVLAIGKPKEMVLIEDLKSGGEIKYWRDNNGIHHVPKRRLDDLIID